MTSGLPFDDIRNLLRGLPALEAAAPETRIVEAVGPSGRIADILSWLEAASGRPAPALARPAIVIFAGSHGVTSSDERMRIATLVEACTAGTAPVGSVCGQHELGLKVFDLALDLPTADFTRDAALDEKTCAATIAYGMEAVAGGIDLLGVSCASAGGDISAAAILAALDHEPRQGPASGDDAPAAAVASALKRHIGHLGDPLEVLRRLGGRETAAAAGAIIAARTERVPVLLDGDGALAAAAVLHAFDAGSVAHCRLAEAGSNGRRQRAGERLGIVPPLLDFGSGLEDGTAAALATVLARSIARAFLPG